MNMLVPVRRRALDQSNPVERLLNAFLSGKKQTTLDAYRMDLTDFQRYMKCLSLSEAAQILISRTPGDANMLALDYKASLMERKLASLTINRRLTALRMLTKLARTLGMIVWTLEVQSLKAEVMRDTRGPGRQGFQDMLNLLTGNKPKTVRDRALLRCLFDLGLRRAEVLGIDMCDIDLADGSVMILGKGRSSKERLTMPIETRSAVAKWIKIRGEDPGPLFKSLDRGRKGSGRLGGRCLHLIIQQLGARVGLKVWPHALRHSSITAALDLTDGNIRAVQKFSRHKDVRVLEVYDDTRRDLAGEVASKVAASVADVA